MTEKDKEINELRREVQGLRAALTDLMNLVVGFQEGVINYIIKYEGGEQHDKPHRAN